MICWMSTIDGYVADVVNEFPKNREVLFWLSLPCTGGTSLSYVNLKIPSAARKVMKHVRTLRKLWKAVEQFTDLMSFTSRLNGLRITETGSFRKLKSYSFHGCMLGTTDDEGIPIKKSWTVATSMSEVGNELIQFQCDGNHHHAQGRGKSLKNTESYTYTFQFTETVRMQSFESGSSLCSKAARKYVIATPAILSCHHGFFFSRRRCCFWKLYPEGQDNVVANWKQNCDFQVEGIPSGERLSVYTRVQEWERRLAKVRASCAACAFPDGC